MSNIHEIKKVSSVGVKKGMKTLPFSLMDCND